MSDPDMSLRPRPGETAEQTVARVTAAARKEVEADKLDLVLNAAEEWAEFLDGQADNLSGHGEVGRQAATVTRAEAAQLRDAIVAFRPLRRRDPETDEWVE